MTSSMTGYARQEVTHSWGSIIWEIRSLNHRYLEPHFRLPESLRAIEPELRNRLRKWVHRGKVEMSAHLQILSAAGEQLEVNLDVARQVAAALQQINGLVDQAAPINSIDVLNWPGVLSSQSLDQEAIQAAALSAFDQALKSLCEHRKREGAELAQLIDQRLDAVSVEMAKVRQVLPEIMQAQRDKMLERIELIKADINPERLEQELVFYAQKADVDEELDRLGTHVAEVRHTLKQSGSIGRRLDFLMQELNREANTLSSKSIASDTTQSAVELKILIEQMREQIQNIE